MKWFIISVLLFSVNWISAQKDVRVEINTSADTIYMNNPFKLEYIIHNGRPENLSAPDLSDFDILQGPSSMQNMSIINGVQSIKSSLTYYVQPKSSGNFKIESYEVDIEGKSYKSQPKKLVILDNPDGIIQDPNTGRIKGGVPTKRKKVGKRYKI